MKNCSIKYLVLGCLVFLNTLILNASTITNLINKIKVDDKYKSYNQVVVFDSINVLVKPSGLAYVTSHSAVLIKTAMGAKDANVIKLDYDPLSAYIEFKVVKIYRNNGNIESLSLDKVIDYPAPARMIYWGARQKMIELGKLEPGDAYEIITFRKGFTYALLTDDDDRYIPPMKGHFYDIVEFWSNRPVVQKIYSVTLPVDKNLQYRFSNGEFIIKKSPSNEQITYSFTTKDFFPLPAEDHMVALSDVAPKLLLSTSPDWQAKSLWFYSVNEDYGSFTSTPEIKNKVNEILIDAQNEIDSIAILTHWVADEIRYSGLSMGPGEGYTLHKGEMNFTDRCGVCKDKAGMLVTMLRAAGFESYAAMTMAGSRIEDIPADQFNHSVTVVKLRNGVYKILDPTWVPFVRELWSSREQQQNYLMGLPQGSNLMITPVSDPKNHKIQITINTQILKDGSLQAEFELNADGQSDASVRSIFTYAFKEQWKRNLEKQFLIIHPSLVIDTLYFSNPYDYLKTPVIIFAKFRIPDYAVKTNNFIVFKPLALQTWFQYAQTHLYFDTTLTQRKYPFADRCSRMVEVTENIKIPLEMIPESLLKSQRIKSEIAEYALDADCNNDIISLHQRIKLSKRVYQPNEWPDYRNAVAGQINASKNYIILKRK